MILFWFHVMPDMKLKLIVLTTSRPLFRAFLYCYLKIYFFKMNFCKQNTSFKISAIGTQDALVLELWLDLVGWLAKGFVSIPDKLKTVITYLVIVIVDTPRCGPMKPKQTSSLSKYFVFLNTKLIWCQKYRHSNLCQMRY